MTTLPVWRSVFDFLPAADSSILDPVVHALGDGSFVVLWTSTDSVLPPKAWMRTFTADGTPKADPVEITLAGEVANAGKFSPTVTVLRNGNFVVAWQDESGGDGEIDAGIRGQIFNSNGGKIGQDFHINSVLEGSQVEVAIEALANGGFAVAYTDAYSTGDGSGPCVRTRIFDASGAPIARPGEDPNALVDIIANAETTSGQLTPDIVALKGGGYIVIFEDNSLSPDDPNLTLRGRIFKADGTPASESDFLIPVGAPGSKAFASAATLADGRFVVAWESSSSATRKDVMARVFDASGTAVTVELPMNQGEEAFQSDPQVVALIDGGFAISYRSQSSTGSGIRIATFGSGGEFKGNFTVELPEGSYLERAPSISVLSDGRLVVTWVEQDIDAGTYSARSQIFDPRVNAVNLSGSELGDHYFGTALNDYLSGNGGNDTLDGGAGDDVLIGGAGFDVFVGGGGNDIYYIENGDTVIEGGGGGYDTIVASYSATLGDNTQVEVLQAAAGAAPLSLGGANMNDTLIGNDGHNVINGGTGADRMTGQGGNDTYHVDNASDAVIEVSASGGEDHVLASVNFSLGAFVEKLTAMGTLGLALTGNDLGNTIAGNDGRNTIRAGAGADTILGGKGNDLLYGGVGKDVFVFDTTGHKTRNKDKILDWKYRDDTIKLDQDIFKKLKVGKLQSKYFTLGAAAKDANDYIGVNKKTGDIWYDKNGDKAGGQVIFANIGKNKAIFASDFFVF